MPMGEKSFTASSLNLRWAGLVPWVATQPWIKV